MRLSPKRAAIEAEEAEYYARSIALHRAGKLANAEVDALNRRIIRQHSLTALRRIKARAWAIVEGRAK